MSAENKPARTANIFDVARLAGVSHQTVSRVINDFPNVRPETRRRVEQAIEQLRYIPSPAARALVTKRTRMIGLITPGSADFGPSSIALHFAEAARDARYGVVSVTSINADASSIRQVIESLLSQRVEAIVLIVADVALLGVVRGLDIGVPVIAVAAGPRRGPLAVSVDQYRGARAAVRHLIELGHRRIAHLAGPPTAPDAIERLRGWRDELAAATWSRANPDQATGRRRVGSGTGQTWAATRHDRRIRGERPDGDRTDLGAERQRPPGARRHQRGRFRRRAGGRVTSPRRSRP